MVKEFVDGWDIIQALGEGACGEVLLVMNRQTNEAVAAKSIDLKHADTELVKNTRKEVYIHRTLKHENIVKFFGHREEPHMYFIFLEYACGGELFDRIEPDYGMPEANAHNYFSQIIAGVEYLHSVGVAHRDLKPENILLDTNDVIKISDFGLATLFRYNGKERQLTKRCGTLSYVSPEVFSRAYRATPSDIWSCGIILVAMLAGELPWDQPTMDCDNFVSWRKCNYSLSPWPKVENLALAIAKKILEYKPEKRYTIAEIKNHLWFKKTPISKAVVRWNSSNSISYKKQRSDLHHSRTDRKIKDDLVPSCSQPEPVIRDECDVAGIPSTLDVLTHGICFSQPAHPENMMLCSQMISTQGDCSQPSREKLVVRRMTRFCVKMDSDSATAELKTTLDELGYTWKKFAPGQVVVNTVDRRKTNLVFKATLLEMNDYILFDFRLSRGDGLEFKRHFLEIRRHMTHIIVKRPIVWPT